jgi:hypothetical protein
MLPIKAPAPAPTTTPSVVVESLLPNPVGNDEQLEEITLKNKSSTPIALTGWILRDHSGLVWNLSETLAAGQSRTIRRNGQALTLNNAGDEVVLLDAMAIERDRFSYTASSEGVRITTGH